jgi:hypothetical protein
MMSTMLAYPLIALGAAGLIIWILELIIHAGISLGSAFSKKPGVKKPRFRIQWLVMLASAILIFMGLATQHQVGSTSGEFTWCAVLLGYTDVSTPQTFFQLHRLTALSAYSEELLGGCTDLLTEINSWGYFAGIALQFGLGLVTILLIRKRKKLVALLVGGAFIAYDIYQVLIFTNHLNSILAQIGIAYGDESLQAIARQLLIEVSILHFMTLLMALIVSNYIIGRFEMATRAMTPQASSSV